MDKKRVLIVGAGEAGLELLVLLTKHLQKKYHVAGFLDDDLNKRNKKYGKVPVLGKIIDIKKVIKKENINEVFIAIPSARGETIRKIVEGCKEEKVIFRIVPRILEMIQGKVRLDIVREVQLEDLLGRAIVKSEQKVFDKEFGGKKILVTGAAGSIGSELCRQLIQFKPSKLIALDRWENGVYDLQMEMRNLDAKNCFSVEIADVREYEKVKRLFDKYRPDIVFHAAAFKHVPLMQHNIDEAVKNNVFGTENIVKVATEFKVQKLVNISTDKAADPSNVMGTTKLIGEKIVASKYTSVRFGNVMDSFGSVIPLFRKQISEGGPVTVTDPRMTRFLMTIPEAVQLLLHACNMSRGGEIFILDMGEPILIDDLARLMIQLAGFVPDEEIKIEYIGKRPGEKMNEVLTTKKELLEKTSHKRIFKVKPETANDIINDLHNMVNEGNEETLWNILKKYAPNLQENNSENSIPLTRPDIGEKEIAAVLKTLKSGWFTMGKETEKFEEEFAKYVGAKYAIAVNSCTAALFLSLKALGVGPGDEVIVPSFTFASSASVITHCGATPVFADINDQDFTMTQKSVNSLITKKTKAIIVVHYGGNRANIKSEIPIIEDSAHLIPKNGDNQKSFANCYSFYATKNITTGEGGMITTSDEKLADWYKKARLHGLSRDAWKRYDVKSKWMYTVEFPGYKVNTTDINSALGRIQLSRLDQFELRRRHVIELYNKLLGLNNKGTHLYPILIENRDEFFEFMKAHNIGCSFHFKPLHLEPAFKMYSNKKLPITEKVGSQVVTLPLDAVISDDQVKEVARLVRLFNETHD